MAKRGRKRKLSEPGDQMVLDLDEGASGRAVRRKRRGVGRPNGKGAGGGRSAARRQVESIEAASSEGDSTDPQAVTQESPNAASADASLTGAAVVDHRVAEDLARRQREISISEFFAKNRHLLGFDNKRRALLTTVKEAVDNALDACEEAGILPEVEIRITQISEDRYCVAVRDNGPGIVKEQIPRIFGKLLYGSKFHRLKMSRGQQGIGISAAGMYGLLTTGKPVRITSRTGPSRSAHYYEVQIDTTKNEPKVVKDEPIDVDWPHGTLVEIELAGSYMKGRQSVDEYVFQTAIANPHARITYRPPNGEVQVFERASDRLPPPTREIKPHPYGIDLGLLIQMLRDSHHRTLAGFLQDEFCRVSAAVARQICERAGLAERLRPSRVSLEQAERLYEAMQKVKVMAPPTDCLAPIGAKQILAGLLQGVKAEFFTAVTRDPAVYRGHPFLVEAGLAYGGQLPGDDLAKVIRFANRVPLLYQQSACAIYKTVVETNWRNYGLEQSRGAPPTGPLVIVVHLASVWVPFTSESKEAIASYDEICREIKLALQECGRKLAAFLRKRGRKQKEKQRRSVFLRYITEIVEAVNAIKPIDKEKFRDDLLKLAKKHTSLADIELDEEGRPIIREEDQTPEKAGPEVIDETTVVVRRSQEGENQEPLLELVGSAGSTNDRAKGGRKAG